MGKRIGNMNLVNYKDHPTNERFKILNFNSLEESDMFEKLLIEREIWYEHEVEEHQGTPLYLFAVKNKNFEKVQRINFLVNAKFRSPMIKSRVGQYLLVGFFFAIIIFALVGYFKSGN